MTKAGHGVMLRTDWSNFACTLTPFRESNLLAHTHKDVMLEQGTAIAVWDLEA